MITVVIEKASTGIIATYGDLVYPISHASVPVPTMSASMMATMGSPEAETLKMSGRHVSVDAPFVEGEDNSLIDVMVNEDSPNADRGLINESLSTEINRALATLTPREADILRKFFGIGTPEKTLEEIGDELHLTRERVRQIKEKAIRKLNSGQRSHILMTYLG